MPETNHLFKRGCGIVRSRRRRSTGRIRIETEDRTPEFRGQVSLIHTGARLPRRPIDTMATTIPQPTTDSRCGAGLRREDFRQEVTDGASVPDA